MFDLKENRALGALVLSSFLYLLSLCWLFIALISYDSIDRVFSESGPIELLSAVYLIVAAILLAGNQIRRKDTMRWHISVLLAAAALRELDWDKAFTDRGILSLGLYTGGAPLGQKLAGGAAVILLAWCGLRVLRHDLLPWLQSLRAKEIWAWLVASTISLYAVAKCLDGLRRKVANYGIQISESASLHATRIEELMELLGATLALQAVLLFLRAARNDRAGLGAPSFPPR